MKTRRLIGMGFALVSMILAGIGHGHESHADAKAIRDLKAKLVPTVDVDDYGDIR